MSDELVDAYRLPQLVRGWEIGLVRFVRARVAGRPVLTTVCGVTVAAGHFHAELAYLDGQHCIAVTVCSSHRLHVTAACVAVVLCWQQRRKRKEKEKKRKSAV